MNNCECGDALDLLDVRDEEIDALEQTISDLRAKLAEVEKQRDDLRAAAQLAYDNATAALNTLDNAL